MKPRLFWTMLLAFALVIVLSVCGMLSFVGLALSGRWQPEAVRESFQSFQANYANSLGDYYEANRQSWAGVQQRFDAPPFGGPNSFFGYALVDARGQIVASNERNLPVGGQASARDLQRGVPINARGAQVGTLVFSGGPRAIPDLPALAAPPAPARSPHDYIWPIARSFVIAGLILSGSLLLLAVLFAQRLSRPLRQLTAAAQQLATGKLDVQVGRARIFEIDELNQAFNGMAQSLAAADRQRRQMTADVAHELRTPLTIIKGRLEGLQDGVYAATPAELDRLLSETALLERLIEDLRLLALAEAGQMPLYRELIDPHDLLEHTRAAFAGQAHTQGVALLLDAPAELPAIDADPQRMAQVLANLVANALRYTPAGGTIALRAALETKDERQKTKDLGISSSSPSGGSSSCVIFSVCDTGKGIAAADLPHIFDRFYRADRSRTRGSGGAGLGLAIARQIVVAHGGAIWAESAEGQGSTISIALPTEELNEQ